MKRSTQTKEPSLLERLQEFRKQVRELPVLTADPKTRIQEQFAAALLDVGYGQMFAVIAGHPPITDRKMRAELRHVALEMIAEFENNSKDNDLSALLKLLIVRQKLDPRFAGF